MESWEGGRERENDELKLQKMRNDRQIYEIKDTMFMRD